MKMDKLVGFVQKVKRFAEKARPFIEKCKFVEKIIRIVFGALFIAAGVVVHVVMPDPYTLVAVVLYINGILCIISGIVELVKRRRAAKMVKENVNLAAKKASTAV